MNPRILLYGATGYTGRRTAKELERLGADFVIAGRNSERLSAISRELGGREFRVADAAGRLDGLADGMAVMISTVGPFEKFGETAVAEALRAGAHFCDTTGEQGYMKRVLERFDREARGKNVTIINAQAFEFAVGYCLGALLLDKHPETETLDLFNRPQGFGASRGTKKSAIGAIGGDALILRDGKLVDRGSSPVPMDVEWPGEGKLRAAPFPGGEALHLPKIGSKLRNVTTNLVLPAAGAWAMTGLFAARSALRPLANSRLTRWLERRIDSGPEGPPDAEAAAARWSVVARARGPYGERVARADGADPYGITGTIAANGAMLLAAGQARTAGVVSTAEAFDPGDFLNRLADRGVTYRIDSRGDPYIRKTPNR